MGKLDKTQEEWVTELIRKIKEEDEYTIGTLMTLYKYQTLDEQESGITKYDNKVGFNGVDSDFLSSLARQYEKNGSLSEKQIRVMRPMLLKYARQIMKLDGAVRMPNTRFSKKEGFSKEPKEEYKRVGLSKKDPDMMIIEWAPFDKDILSKVKTIPLRRWVQDRKWWKAPVTVESVKMLLEWGFKLSPGLEKEYKKLTEPIEIPELDVMGLKKNLFPFQKEGVQFIESRNGKALVGDEMGLGKTVQALAWLQYHPELRPVVLVVPASVKYNWLKEATAWMEDPKAMVLSGKNSGALPKSWEMAIINYDILPSWVEELQKWGPKVVVLDESHYIKNRKAQRTKAVQKLCKGVDHVIGLSGTPIINRPVEFFNVLNLLAPKRFPSFWKYAQEFCGARHNGFGWDFTGSSNTETLHELLTSSVMIRRKKEDVLKDLPEKIRAVVPTELTNWEEYVAAEQAFREWVNSEERKQTKKWDPSSQAEALTHIEKMKQLCLDGKLKGCIEWIDDFLEGTDKKIVLFATHQRTVDALAEHYGRMCVVLDGRTPVQSRPYVIDKFQEDPEVRVFIGNIKAAGVGITLTASDTTCFLELGWTPGEHDQAEDRVHRIGQESDSVMAYYLITPGTIEDYIIEILDEKRKVLAQVLDGREVESSSLLMDLIGKFSE